MKSKSFFSNIKRLTGAFLLVVTLSTGVLFCNIATAKALTQTNTSFTVAMKSNIADQALGSGTTDKIEGKAEKDLGTIQKNLGNTERQIKGTAKQIKGRAKQDIGEVKNRIDRASSDLEEASDNVVDAIQNFLGQ